MTISSASARPIFLNRINEYTLEFIGQPPLYLNQRHDGREATTGPGVTERIVENAIAEFRSRTVTLRPVNGKALADTTFVVLDCHLDLGHKRWKQIRTLGFGILHAADPIPFNIGSFLKSSFIDCRFRQKCFQHSGPCFDIKTYTKT